MGGALHLAKRFFGAVKPGPPSAEDESWALAHLLPGEADVWRRMNNPDRRHAVGVARAVTEYNRSAAPSAEPERAVIAAALLHDCGKVICRFRTPARVLATVVWSFADDDLADRWLARDPGTARARLAQYRRHPELGRDLLQQAGSARLTSDWAAEHHQPETAWSVPIDIGRVLKDCDDD